MPKGKKLSEETKKKMGKAHKGKKPYEMTDEIRKKISKSRIGQFKSDKHWNWQGGISNNSYSIDWTETLRQSIRERDRYTCKLCHKKQGDRALSVHHIDYNKQNNNPKNLIALCYNCHTKTNFNRKFWIKYFNNLI
jgi:hypothetical protein